MAVWTTWSPAGLQTMSIKKASATTWTMDITWPLVVMCPTGFNIASGRNKDLGYLHGLWWYHRPQISTWPPVRIQTTVSHMASGCSMDQGHGCQHGLQWHHRPQASVWPSAEAWCMDGAHLLTGGSLWPSAWVIHTGLLS